MVLVTDFLAEIPAEFPTQYCHWGFGFAFSIAFTVQGKVRGQKAVHKLRQQANRVFLQQRHSATILPPGRIYVT